ncbi:hypothetical protein [Streptomyces lavendulae]|uniref:hypothetical protein n=1 Tax=Streptomyces lavendulae TaxID=1914 RepID=UPI0031EDD669
MPLIDEIEFYGRAIEAREMTREQAVQLLVEASAGGLTELGARTSIDGWRTVRADYAEAFDQAREIAVLRWRT